QVSPEHPLRTRQRIVYVPPRVPEPPVDTRYTVLYEDEHLLAVSKSANIPTSPSGKYWHHSLRLVLQRERGLERLHAVHRLDRETSGVNLFAKTAQAARLLGDAFHQGRVTKTYVAILQGHLAAREVWLNAPLADAGGVVHVKQAVRQGGRPAQTRFVLQALLPGASLVQVLPLTGRTHQIRAHAAFLGHPVWGDRLYGVPEEEFIRWVASPERDLSGRHLLHAASLELAHPLTGQLLLLQAPRHDLMQVFLAQRAAPVVHQVPPGTAARA
ncbi:MAG TPA: RluA family pseudouridine synthase, partial [bacterium]|nr:RluA family pseudouridine synthase [bacterium]